MTTEQPVTDSASQEAAAVSKLEAMFGGDEPETPEEIEQNASPESGEQPTEEPEGAQDDSEDVDFEGLQLKLPKEAASKLKSAVEGYKDYTQKTQKLAEHQRAVAAREALVAEQQAFQASITPELSQFQQIDAQLAEYRKLDWTALPMEEAMRYRVQFDLLKDKKEELGRALQGKKQEFDQKLANHKRSLREAQEKAVKLAIPDWKAESAQQLSTYAETLGYTDAELANSYDHRLVIALHKAAQWDALQASKPGVTQRANAAPRVVKPGASSTQPNKQIALMNYKKAVKNASSDSERARIIQSRLESKFR